ncbi:MAG: hypothetical protein ACRBCI_03785 [Cellvibrionaceae bacterium]
MLITFRHSLTFLLVGILLPHFASASCERDDIEFYLESGFTPSQITDICVGNEKEFDSSREVNNLTKDDKKILLKERSQRDSNSFLMLSIRAKNINISSDYLSYVAHECIEYEPAPDGFSHVRPKEYCGLIQTKIIYEGISFAKSSQGFKLFQKPTVTVKGRVYQVAEDSKELNRLKKYDRKLLSQLLNKVSKVDVPLRDNIDMGRFKLELTRLSE